MAGSGITPETYRSDPHAARVGKESESLRILYVIFRTIAKLFCPDVRLTPRKNNIVRDLP